MKTKMVLLLLLFALSALPLFAQDRVVDNANLLSSSERDRLAARMNTLSETYNFDLVLVTERDIGGADAVSYADDFFIDNGFGQGSGKDGSLFLVAIETRDYGISASGRGVDILNNYAFNKLESVAVKSLRANNYYAAFNSFLDNWEQFLTLEAKGRSYNFFYQWNIVLVIIVWLIGLAIGFIVVQIWKKGMNTALPQAQAASYMVSGSLAFSAKTDKFLYSDTKKTVRASSTAASSLAKASRAAASGRRSSGRRGKF